jgi:hypothetical protein
MSLNGSKTGLATNKSVGSIGDATTIRFETFFALGFSQKKCASSNESFNGLRNASANNRRLRRVGGNTFERVGSTFVIPDVYFNWLLQVVGNRKKRYVVASRVSAGKATALANAIEQIHDREMMLGIFGDPEGEATTSLCQFLREGGVFID